MGIFMQAWTRSQDDVIEKYKIICIMSTISLCLYPNSFYFENKILRQIKRKTFPGPQGPGPGPFEFDLFQDFILEV